MHQDGESSLSDDGGCTVWVHKVLYFYNKWVLPAVYGGRGHAARNIPPLRGFAL
jgi:hypothetical protein